MQIYASAKALDISGTVLVRFYASYDATCTDVEGRTWRLTVYEEGEVYVLYFWESEICFAAFRGMIEAFSKDGATCYPRFGALCDP